MNARFLTTATLATVFAGLLPAKAADPQLLNLVMPDAKVLAGVNVDQAKTSPFGQYVLSQMQLQDTHLTELTALTGFDPTRDVHELLVASSGGANQQTGLALARGNFDPARINALRLTKGAASEIYNGVTIIEDPKQQGGFAFLNATIVAAGDLANVKARHRPRRRRGVALPTSVMRPGEPVEQHAGRVGDHDRPAQLPAPGHRHARRFPASDRAEPEQRLSTAFSRPPAA